MPQHRASATFAPSKAPYTSVNGHMFSYVAKDGTVALRLPTATREAYLTKYDSALSAQYAVTQQEYVVVPPH